MAKKVKKLVKEDTQEAVQEQQNKPNALLITVELANALIEYLSKDTLFSEVDGLVNGIRQSRAVTVTDEKKEEQ